MPKVKAGQSAKAGSVEYDPPELVTEFAGNHGFCDSPFLAKSDCNYNGFLSWSAREANFGEGGRKRIQNRRAIESGMEFPSKAGRTSQWGESGAQFSAAPPKAGRAAQWDGSIAQSSTDPPAWNSWDQTNWNHSSAASDTWSPAQWSQNPGQQAWAGHRLKELGSEYAAAASWVVDSASWTTDTRWNQGTAWKRSSNTQEARPRPSRNYNAEGDFGRNSRVS